MASLDQSLWQLWARPPGEEGPSGHASRCCVNPGSLHWAELEGFCPELQEPHWEVGREGRLFGATGDATPHGSDQQRTPSSSPYLLEPGSIPSSLPLLLEVWPGGPGTGLHSKQPRGPTQAKANESERFLFGRKVAPPKPAGFPSECKCSNAPAGFQLAPGSSSGASWVRLAPLHGRVPGPAVAARSEEEASPSLSHGLQAPSCRSTPAGTSGSPPR